MQVFSKLRYSLLALAAAFVLVIACKNDDTPEPVVTISGINPSSAPAGADIKITGTEFGSTVSAVTVTFTGGAKGTVKAVTPTEITATVPTGVQNGPVTVQVGNKSATSSASFSLGAKPVVEVQNEITTSTTWNSNTVYLIRGFVYVRDGVTLTIQPGTVIKGALKEQDPSGQQKGGTLIVQPGGKLIAEGTADRPIVFTSSKPAGQRGYGDWGGIVLIGKAPINRPGSQNFEGGIAGTTGTFNLPADNSGVLKYVRIEFAGVALSNATNSEINGLTLYGVGTGTVIDYVQVSYSGDDAYEWFGGTANAKHLIAYRNFDDDFDADWGFTGKVQYALTLRDPAIADQSGSNGFESDNFSGDGTPATGPNAGLPLTEPIFANVSAFAFSGTPVTTFAPPASGPYQSAMHLRRNTAISIFNSVFVGYPEGLRLDQAPTYANVTGGKLQLRGIVLANMNTPVRGAGTVTDAQVQEFFGTAAFKNQIVAAANLGTLGLNPNTFRLDGTAAFTPNTGSPLLTGAIWDGKGADGFFTKETFIGAFGAQNWAEKWANFNPQQTDYDK